ncbi:tyrosine-type recombinase/integrase, partial [Colwellia sp. E150_009]
MKLFLSSPENNPVYSFLLTLESKFSVKTYYSRLLIFCDYYFNCRDFSKCDWSKLNHFAVLKYMRFEENNDKAHTSINLTLSALKNVAYECWKQDVISIENYTRIKTIKKIKGTRAASGRVLTFDEITKIQNHFKNKKDNKSIRNYALFALGIGCGLRRGELLSLNTTDIKNNHITIHGKGNKSRKIYLPSFTIVAVKRLLENINARNKPLFSKILKSDEITNKRISSMGISTILEQIINNTKINYFTAHDMRRTFATTLLEVGADKIAVQKLMGHSSLN